MGYALTLIFVPIVAVAPPLVGAAVGAGAFASSASPSLALSGALADADGVENAAEFTGDVTEVTDMYGLLEEPRAGSPWLHAYRPWAATSTIFFGKSPVRRATYTCANQYRPRNACSGRFSYTPFSQRHVSMFSRRHVH